MNIRGIFSSIDISASGLAAQRRRMDAISQNIANVNTTRTEDGGPYRRRIAVFEEEPKGIRALRITPNEASGTELSRTHGSHIAPFESKLREQNLSGVQMREIRDDTTPEFIYDPSHPDANEFGYVAMPKINVITEMVDMISASRNYEANVAALEAAKAMAKKAMEI